MRTVTLFLSLALAVPALAAPSRGAATEQRDEVKEALAATAKAEKELMEGIFAALGAMDPLPVSDAAKAQYEESKALVATAEELWKQQEFRQAYTTFRDASAKLQPALVEVLALPDVPQSVQDAGAKLVQVNAQRLELLARAVEAKGTPAAKTAYAEARALHEEAKALWAKGERRPAAEKSWASLAKADVAIREMWQAYAPAAKGR